METSRIFATCGLAVILLSTFYVWQRMRKTMKKIGCFPSLLRFSALLVALFLLLYIVGSIVQQPYEDYEYVIFNDTLVEVSGTVYSIGDIMVQLEWFCDLIGAETSQDGRKITINWHNKELIIKLYSKKATLNEKPLYLANAPVYKDGKVFVHIRTVCDNMGMVLDYRGITERSETIDYSKLLGNDYIYIYTPDYLLSLKGQPSQ